MQRSEKPTTRSIFDSRGESSHCQYFGLGTNRLHSDMLLLRWLRSLQSKQPDHSHRKNLRVRILSSTHFAATRQSAVLITFTERQHSLSIYPTVRNSEGSPGSLKEAISDEGEF